MATPIGWYTANYAARLSLHATLVLEGHASWSFDIQQLLLTEPDEPVAFNAPDLQQGLCSFEGGVCIYRFGQPWRALEHAGKLEALRDGL